MSKTMKDNYVVPEIEMIVFNTEDVISESNTTAEMPLGGGDNTTPEQPIGGNSLTNNLTGLKY